MMMPRVTIVVTQRERMSLTERSLESILADGSEPFDLIYVDGGSASGVRDYLSRRSLEAGFRLIRSPSWLWPNVARNLALPHVVTDYVVFIDNDVLVETGWLGKLVAAADETGAALVGPIYLWSDGIGEPRIHMAGGSLMFEQSHGGVDIHERHDRFNESVAVRSDLIRGTCDFLEYHCMLVRMDFVKGLGGLDEQIVCVHEHIDLALVARKKGLAIVTEPGAAVDYLAYVPLQLDDLPFYRWRWSAEAVATSLDAFSARWNAVADGPGFGGVLRFAVSHREKVDPFLPRLRASGADKVMTAGDVRQTLYGLLTQAASRGYVQSELLLIGKAYNAAINLVGDGFRPCGRPFLLHCVGTASVLVAYGFAVPVVIAGMLHAAYSHARIGTRPAADLEELQVQLNTMFGDRVEQIVCRYARFQTNPERWCAQRPVSRVAPDDAEVMAIAIANEIDEHCAGEFHFTVKRPLGPSWYSLANATAWALGVPALADTLNDVSKLSAPAGFALRRTFTESFRQVGGAPVPMAHGHFAVWDSQRTRVAMQVSAPVSMTA